MEPSSSSSATASSAAATLSLVSRAKTALHSAAAKAERVFTDIKADLKSDRDRDGQAQRETRKSTDRELVVSDASNESKEEDLHGVPPESFVFQISLIIGGMNSLQKMASFWHFLVLEQFQVINCCIARKERKKAAKELLDSVIKQASLENSDSIESSSKLLYARSSSGNYILRLGADHPSEKNLTMLETGEPIYSPVTQEGPVLTEEHIKEAEELVLRTGSVGAGCSQLLSDMQAFKAANPGCVLEDFVRWHSPPDWTADDRDDESVDGEGSSRRGRLSRRMQKEGNLWRELWETAKALPAAEQTPLFDEDLAVESIFTALEDIPPAKFFEQLFVSILSVGFTVAEVALPADSYLSKLFYECKDYISSVFQADSWNEKLDDICKVYETIEAIMIHPEEAIMITGQPDETNCAEKKSRFKKVNIKFINKDRQPLWKRAAKDEKKSEEKMQDEKHTHIFSHIFDKKVSLFSKKNPKADASSSPSPAALDESEWTIV